MKTAGSRLAAPKRANVAAAPASAKSNRATSAKTRTIVGWREWVALPELDVERIRAKLDTGARTSALHAFNITPLRKRGKDWIRFDLHPIQRNDAAIKACVWPVADYRWVMNSGGKREKRFVVVTNLRLGEEEWPVEITLTDRDQMGFRMLIGRTAIKGRYIVDPARSFCIGKANSAKRRKGPAPKRRQSNPARDEEE